MPSYRMERVNPEPFQGIDELIARIVRRASGHQNNLLRARKRTGFPAETIHKALVTGALRGLDDAYVDLWLQDVKRATGRLLPIEAAQQSAALTAKYSVREIAQDNGVNSWVVLRLVKKLDGMPTPVNGKPTLLNILQREAVEIALEERHE